MLKVFTASLMFKRST